MTDEQIRLYAIARCVVPTGTRIRTFSEPTSGEGRLYTLEIKTPGRGWPERWFAVHGNSLVKGLFPDGVIAAQVREAIERPAPA